MAALRRWRQHAGSLRNPFAVTQITVPLTPPEGFYRADWDYRGQRQIVPLAMAVPYIAPDAWVAPNATLIGNVKVEDKCTVWYGTVLRGDLNKIQMGFCSHIFDRCVLHVASESPVGLPPHLIISHYVTIGPYCTLRSCIIERECIIGERCVVMEGSVVETHSILEPGSVVPPGRRIPTGEVWAGNPAKFVRMVTFDETKAFVGFAEGIRSYAQQYFREFLPYSTAYLELEKIMKNGGVTLSH
ncbi:hypothetical protein SELMODRAFT_169127 [Selaginella moellendorffii]|uniref:Uncharacterized protein n=1 Tax=Selaginella moellendorffii TaxID=88036 RepID=D8R8Q8_SELML|nr:gamma carbonic anhydrase-like 1, mitochondrial [Selaginella moellendorffii]EFJ32106.1 hypothetical protein SELMODRAFT_169127 [Selaginella moellendorffii]|eukprot:XP_002967507.1 gamma carbonic anhydrase-like 1, mitochondrial [Selaginella moellendorffii]